MTDFYKFLCIMSVLWVCASCADEEATTAGVAASSQDSPGGVATATPAMREQFDGTIVPRNATKMRAPQNTFRVGNWQSDSSWIKLQDLAEDGEEVKQGDMIGRFEFRGKQALPGIQERIQRAEAESDRAGLDVNSQLAEMTTTRDRNVLDAERAELDTRKEGVVSARDLDRLEIAYDLAEFEASAQDKQIRSFRRSVAADKSFQKQSVAQAHGDMSRYKTYEQRFVVVAPHDGVVRHGYHPRRRRKIAKGDGMPSGMHFASVARDTTLAVEIFIPEHRYAVARSQDRFVVKSPSSSKTYEVHVKKVYPFPQEIGFIRQNNDLPNAREKVYVLEAEFSGQDVEELSAGLEVKVVMP
jgi:multidrug efflux pump subunit AcrA (membrane-fusion protein)